MVLIGKYGRRKMWPAEKDSLGGGSERKKEREKLLKTGLSIPHLPFS